MVSGTLLFSELESALGLRRTTLLPYFWNGYVPEIRQERVHGSRMVWVTDDLPGAIESIRRTREAGIFPKTKRDGSPSRLPKAPAPNTPTAKTFRWSHGAFIRHPDGNFFKASEVVRVNADQERPDSCFLLLSDDSHYRFPCSPDEMVALVNAAIGR